MMWTHACDYLPTMEQEKFFMTSMETDMDTA